MTIKVLHIMSGFGGGISAFVWNKIKSVDKNKVTFDVLTYDECSTEFINDVENMGGHVQVMPNPKIKGWISFYKTVNNLFKNNKYSMVHSHITGYRAIPFYLIAKKNKINRFVIHAHTSSDETKPEKNIENINRKINNILAKQRVSCGAKSSEFVFGSKYVEQKKIMHIPNSINDSLYFEDEINIKEFKKDILGETSPDTIIIGHVGRFHEVKNHNFMIQIMTQLQKLNVDFVWLFIGEGDLRGDIEAKIEKQGLERFVKFVGRRNDVSKFYSMMDVFVLPSFYEGFPTVAVETQAAGIPTILSNRITKEVDLEMGLIEFEPIDAGVKKWVEKIVQAKNKEILSKEKRKMIIDSKCFSNKNSALLYEEFILKKISHYEI
ncbi:glycosyltransferase [Carnobacterium funditum]|uniref:glycosyltransferase n=1 Tax=Carnobacterium funditum TaxID=2752 RepID=UPI0005548E11|nr:glycosyltransferase [Carnobacterium funditum]